MPNFDETLQLAHAHHQAGRLPEAEQLYRQILQVAPQQPDAWHRLGMIALQVRRFDLAVQYIRQAIAFNSQDAAYFNNLGLAYEGLGQFVEAIQALEHGIAMNPNWAEPRHNLGVMLSKIGRMSEAANSFRAAIRLQSSRLDSLHGLAIAAGQAGQFDESVAAFQQVIRAQPDFVEARSNLGNVLIGQGRLQEACECFRAAISRKPDFVDAYSNYAVALAGLTRVDEAVQVLRRAVELRPDFAAGHSNLGNALMQVGQIVEAETAFQRAIDLQPDYPSAASNLLLSINYLLTISPADALQRHQNWGEREVARWYRPRPFAQSPDPQRRLRIGYVSPDFRNHPVGIFIDPLLKYRDRSTWDVLLYADITNRDAITDRLQAEADVWRETTGMNDDQVAELIRSDRIDILVDLAGHTAKNRLAVFARKPAPVQVAYLGYANTTGLSTIDYRLTDAVADPVGEPSYCTEQLVRLPQGFCCYRPPIAAPEPGPLPALASGRITLGSLNNLPRLNERVLDLWCRLVQSIPDSRLLLYRDTFHGQTAQRFAREFRDRGLTSEQFEIRFTLPPGESHHSVYREIDIALDTFPWTGHTTSCEALWMGVPVVTLRGECHAGRMVASVLTRLELSEWIAHTPDEYVAKVRQLAGDVPALASWRERLRPRLVASSLYDGPAFAATIEAAYRAMWHEWCRAVAGGAQ